MLALPCNRMRSSEYVELETCVQLGRPASSLACTPMQQDVRAVLEEMDLDSSGQIDLDEFQRWVGS